LEIATDHSSATTAVELKEVLEYVKEISTGIQRNFGLGGWSDPPFQWIKRSENKRGPI